MVKKTKELTTQELIDFDDEDQSIETSGSFKKELPPEGETMARFIEYVELGLQPQRPYNNQPKNPAQEVSLVFELLSPDNIREVQIQGQTKMIADKIFITMTKKTVGKAKFFKLFNAMRYGRDSVKHMKKMLGEAFIVDIVHGKSKSDPTKVYANIGTKDSIGLRAPFITDINTRKKKKLKVREALSPLKIFLTGTPTKASWDSLFIDGTWTKNGEEISKNFVQNKIRAALDFKSSPVESMLADLGELPALEDDGGELPEDSLDDIGVEESASTKKKITHKKAIKKKVAPKKTTKRRDALKDIGLTKKKQK